MEEKPILYIIMRNDLPSMNPGKAMAQASHASSLFLHKEFYNTTMSPDKEDIKKWLDEGNGFGTTVVLEGSNDDIANFLMVLEKDYPYLFGTVVDTTYPFFGQKELLDLMPQKYKEEQSLVEYETNDRGYTFCTRIETTCAYVFVNDSEDNLEEIKQVMERHNLKLHR